MAVIAHDGYFPGILSRHVNRIPVYAISCMSLLAFLLVVAGGLEVILEFGSVTFLLVSLLISYANFRIRDLTHSSLLITSLAFIGLLIGAILILHYELNNQPEQLIFIVIIYALLTTGSLFFSRRRAKPTGN